MNAPRESSQAAVLAERQQGMAIETKESKRASDGGAPKDEVAVALTPSLPTAASDTPEPTQVAMEGAPSVS